LTLSRTRSWQVSSHRAMGTASDAHIEGPAALTARCWQRVEQLEQSWSRFRPDSELNQLLARPGVWQPVSTDLHRALALAKRWHAWTDGWFDPSIRPTLEALGYRSTFRALEAPQHLPRPQPSIGLDGLHLDDGVALVDFGLQLDLGGLGKGLAADIVARELVEAGANAVCLSLGGDIAVAGEPATEHGWLIPVVHPLTGHTVGQRSVAAGGIAQSTTAFRAWACGGHPVHHLIDPHVGVSSTTDLCAVAVAATSAVAAEIVAKVAVLQGHRRAVELLDAFDCAGWLMGTDGSVTEHGGLDAADARMKSEH
jgi:FAD:protein FMN transferase